MIRRKQYIVKPMFQLWYTGIIFLTAFIIAAICILTMYYSSVSILGEKLAKVYPQGRLIMTLREINLIIIYRILCLVPFILLAGILLSHRLAGPAYRIEKTLREIGKGNLDIHIRLRKHDELKGIANAINDMVADLKKLDKDKKVKDETQAP